MQCFRIMIGVNFLQLAVNGHAPPLPLPLSLSHGVAFLEVQIIGEHSPMLLLLMEIFIYVFVFDISLLYYVITICEYP